MHCFADISALTAIFISIISCLPSDSPDSLDSQSLEASIPDDFGNIWVDDPQVEPTFSDSNVPVPEDTQGLTADLGEKYMTDADGSTSDSNIIFTADSNASLEKHCDETHTNGRLRIRENGASCAAREQPDTSPRKKKVSAPTDPKVGQYPDPAVQIEADQRCKGYEPFVINLCCPGRLKEPLTWKGMVWYALVSNCNPNSKSCNIVIDFSSIPNSLLQPVIVPRVGNFVA